MAVPEIAEILGDRVRGTVDASAFVYNLQHPKNGNPYNTSNAKNYEDVFKKVYKGMNDCMATCDVK